MVPAMLGTLANAPFRILLPAWACDSFCNAVVQSLTPYFVSIVTAPFSMTLAEHNVDCSASDTPTYTVWFCDTQTVIAGCGVAVLVAAIAALPVWNFTVDRAGKVRAWWIWSLTM